MQKKSGGTGGSFAKTGNLYKYEETAAAGAAGPWGRYTSVRRRAVGQQTTVPRPSSSTHLPAVARAPRASLPSADHAAVFLYLQVLKGHELSVYAGESKVRGRPGQFSHPAQTAHTIVPHSQRPALRRRTSRRRCSTWRMRL
jgi:hypothetical protein